MIASVTLSVYYSIRRRNALLSAPLSVCTCRSQSVSDTNLRCWRALVCVCASSRCTRRAGCSSSRHPGDIASSESLCCSTFRGLCTQGSGANNKEGSKIERQTLFASSLHANSLASICARRTFVSLIRLADKCERGGGKMACKCNLNPWGNVFLICWIYFASSSSAEHRRKCLVIAEGKGCGFQLENHQKKHHIYRKSRAVFHLWNYRNQQC